MSKAVEEPPKKKEWKEVEEEFFKAHGVTDEKEKEAIRGRARINAYDRAKQKYESETAEPEEPKKKNSRWYDE